MKGLDKRLSALEAVNDTADFSHLTDEDLRERICEIADRLGTCGLLDLAAFNDALARGDMRTVQQLIEEVKCEILDAA